MKLREKGVLPESDIYIHNASLICKDYFYQLLCTGHYYCTLGYAVRPNTLGSFLLCYIIKGTLCASNPNGEKMTLTEGSLGIINCHDRPSYWAVENLEFYWIHFDSHNINELYQNMEMHSVNVHDRARAEKLFSSVVDTFAQGRQPREAVINKTITDILTLFFEDEPEGTADARKFDAVINYINNNIDKKISNETLSEMVNMSEFHFIRSFKKETGLSPHEYILKSRVNTAAFLLKATTLSLSEITYKCGYANEAAFSNSFKSYTGITPRRYRQSALESFHKRSRIANIDLLEKENQ